MSSETTAVAVQCRLQERAAQIRECQNRPLNPVYPFVLMDCIHYKVREDGRILSRAAYVVLGVTTEGYKEILSITVGANEIGRAHV